MMYCNLVFMNVTYMYVYEIKKNLLDTLEEFNN